MMVTGMPQFHTFLTGQLPRKREVGQRCDTVIAPLRLGLETLDILRLRRACGSVAQGAGGASVSFLVPAGTADLWHLPGTSCLPGAMPLTPTDPRWLVAPAGAESAVAPTDPWVLRSALCEAVRTLNASGLGPF
ncbi:hypothetical protein [Kitasatospora kifunensis]|uniref:Uncharacterized protein n=1 Tax=Kitasatospora kifunensis TaxID=58351 RepID=A0A7W7VXG8_KITKI|nr:hypothetical protein [Kitasatospora kifunensis]MBB4925590.1 hypothetical protein [Kitasatospora kifunensis]